MSFIRFNASTWKQYGIPNFYYTQRREYPSREYPTEMLGIHNLYERTKWCDHI